MPLQMNGVEAWITVEDKRQVLEYLPEIDTKTGVATCWISGEPGQPFAIRWRDLTDPTSIHQRDMSGFVTMDGYELGGRILQARSYAPAIFSRIATSPTSCLPLTFSDLPRTAGIGEDWVTLGTISIDIHVVEVGEANRLHEGFSSYYRRDEGSPLSSATPFSSTEVTSVRKIATFTFKYRPLDVLQYHHIIPPISPISSFPWSLTPHLGDKRSASDTDEEEECDEEDEQDRTHMYSSSGGSDSDSSQEYVPKSRPRRPLKASYYGPLTKRVKF
ncbi:hypothetical protein JR316_0004372 [Psilocybe cubensis]|uniref:Uncharacterized protein n=2 Tax=Psilocybe cubensis TaxID=181762 RepID=A0A8H8CJK1_PSICU|nr:hypothetical protein JR316_0004372 [Psilocybe cubensis]KAH9482274.1 hypothetical protein JR316_0004372 [Psilocybe cubensis]